MNQGLKPWIKSSGDDLNPLIDELNLVNGESTDDDIADQTEPEAILEDEGWIQSNLIAPEIQDLSRKRVPPTHPLFEKKKLSMELMIDLINILSKAEPDDSKLLFSFQILDRDSKKKTYEKRNPDLYTAQQLIDNKNLLFRVVYEPDVMLSMKLKEASIVIMDLDPYLPVPGEVTSKFEMPLLRALPDMLLNEDPTNMNFLKQRPIVIQSPRGLHMILKIPKNMSPKVEKARKSRLSRLGIKFEYIHHSSCVLIGQNSRLITDVNDLISLSNLPEMLWPLHEKTKDPVVLDRLIECGERYNTIMRGVQNGQFVTSFSGSQIKLVSDYFTEPPRDNYEPLDPGQVKFLTDCARDKWLKKNKQEKALNESKLPTAEFSLVPQDLFTGADTAKQIEALAISVQQSIYQGMKQSAGDRDLLFQLISSNNWLQMAQDLNFRAAAYIYIMYLGVLAGSSATMASMVYGRQKYFVFNSEADSYFIYDQIKGCWSPIGDDMVLRNLREAFEILPIPDLQNKRSLDLVLDDFKSRVTVTSLGKKVSGFAFKDGVLLVGWLVSKCVADAKCRF